MEKIKPPHIRPISENLYELVRPYRVKLASGETITVSNGYKTNGADIPRFLWRLFPPNSPEYMPAVVVHDFLCDKADELTDKNQRKQAFLHADNAFAEILQRLNVPKWKRWLFYKGVRLHHTVRS